MKVFSQPFMAKKEAPSETPLMKQYLEIKSKYPGALLLFRVGDFYETFGEDAVKTAQILGIVLTKRANGAASHIELAGFPHHSLDTYLPKLVRAGQRVAICDQLEDPKLTKKIVKRGVTELVTPGVSFNEKVLNHKTSNYLCALVLQADKAAAAFVDISTGEFMASEGAPDYIDKLIQGFKPSEILFNKKHQAEAKQLIGDRFYTFQLDDWIFQHDYTHDKLTQHFGITTLKGFGLEHMPLAVLAAGVCIHYLNETHHNNLTHIQTLSRIDGDKYVWLDKFTVRNLELIQSSSEGGIALIDVIDNTTTPMGARLLRKWLVLPLKEKSVLDERLTTVENLKSDDVLLHKLTGELSMIGDIERMASKLALRRITPRETAQLFKSLRLIPPIKNLLLTYPHNQLQYLVQQFADCSYITHQIEKILQPEPPNQTNKGGIIQTGVSAELDELRQIAFNGKDYLLQIQQKEQLATGIPSLKVSFNNVFGYYLEVTHTHKEKVPTSWIRKQTLTNAERYITEELKTYEEKILGAEEKINQIEEELFNKLINDLSEQVNLILQNAQTLAKVDCLSNFAQLAIKRKYTKPNLNHDSKITFLQSRHPVIETTLHPGNKYIPNDIYLDKEKQQIIILTGPNMSGKSALLRQTALNVIMAQMGCFVAAKQADIGLVDKIFTRVGASDNISAGESTFMVEMTETASILNNLSENSLVLLDEIGRGTSTYDGVSIAWSIAEFLSNHPAKPKTLFATHYHELNELEKLNTGIKNYHILIKESDNKIIFLRTLVEGGSEHSFGIHVAKMAGVPQLVVNRAKVILKELESQKQQGNVMGESVKAKPIQLNMFEINDPVLAKIKHDLMLIDVNTISPIEALMKLHEIKKHLS